MAIAASQSWAESLRRLGLRSAGGNAQLLKGWAQRWRIDTSHFDPYAGLRGRRPGKMPLEAILVAGSTYSRAHLKQRLYDERIKSPVCELCGQDDVWRGERMAMILDHINGIPDDNRLENLRILCPNCAATLDTHCGRKNKVVRTVSCRACGGGFTPKYAAQRYCSVACGRQSPRRRQGRPHLRKVDRPDHTQLLRELESASWSEVARRYGVTDNAVRKWLRSYESDAPLSDAR